MKSPWNPWTVENWSVSESEWNDPTLPMVTLGVLNYNRCEELRRTLDVLTRAMQYPRYEIIVIDNGSTDGSLDMIRDEFPSVILFEVGRNAGVTARNFMTPLARGKYLFHFDDDTCPGTPAMILRIVQHMEQFRKIDALSTAYYQPVSGLMENSGWERFRIAEGLEGFCGGFAVEGGICFRLERYRTITGYDPNWSLGQEGMELAIQLIQNGLRPYFCPWFLTLHFISTSVRSGGRSYREHRAYANSRQTIWMVAKHWPAIAAYPLLALVVLRRLIALAMHRETAAHNLKGLRDGFRGIRPFLVQRPKLTTQQVLALNRFYIFLFRWA